MDFAGQISMAHYSSSESALRQPLGVTHVRAHQTIMTDTAHPSAVRVFGKSLYMLAGGWGTSILWLWLVGLRQHVDRFGTTPDDFAISLLIAGVVPMLALAAARAHLRQAHGRRADGGAGKARMAARLLVGALSQSLPAVDCVSLDLRRMRRRNRKSQVSSLKSERVTLTLELGL